MYKAYDRQCIIQHVYWNPAFEEYYLQRDSGPGFRMTVCRTVCAAPGVLHHLFPEDLWQETVLAAFHIAEDQYGSADLVCA